MNLHKKFICLWDIVKTQESRACLCESLLELRVGIMQNENKKTEEKYKKLIEHLKRLQEKNFTGYIKVNFTQGSVGRIEQFEEVLKH